MQNETSQHWDDSCVSLLCLQMVVCCLLGTFCTAYFCTPPHLHTCRWHSLDDTGRSGVPRLISHSQELRRSFSSDSSERTTLDLHLTVLSSDSTAVYTAGRQRSHTGRLGECRRGAGDSPSAHRVSKGRNMALMDDKTPELALPEKSSPLANTVIGP